MSIQKEGSKFVVRSHRTGKKLGSFSTKKAAQRHLKRIKRFSTKKKR